MLKSSRQFYKLVFGLAGLLAVALVLVLMAGDSAGKTLQARFEYLPENSRGLPELAVIFEGSIIPARYAVEQALETNPPLSGDTSWDGKVLRFIPALPPTPGTSYRVQLRGGLALKDGGRTQYQPLEWNFTTRPARLLYLKRQERAINLWLDERNGNTPRQLTFETERQVLDYTVSPGGERVVYSLQGADGREASLWLLKLDGTESSPRPLVNEKSARATAPRWSPTGELIAYERRLLFEKEGFTQAQLWLVQPDGTPLPPLYGGSEKTGVYLNWTSGGDKAVFWDPRKEAVGIYNFSGEPEWLNLPGKKLETLAISPDGRDMVLSRFDYSGSVEKVVLERWQHTSKDGWKISPVQIENPAGFSNRLPVFSPDGRYLAFVRQDSKAGQLKSSQLWILDLSNGQTWSSGDGNGLTGSYQWTGTSGKIIMEQYPAGTRVNSLAGEIFELSVSSKSIVKLVSGGTMPGRVN